MKKIVLALALISLFSHPAAWSQIASKNFDWDNNIATLNVKLVLFHKTTGTPKELTTAELAQYGNTIGRSGPYADYEIRTPDKYPGADSFKYYGDGPHGENYFLEQLVETITQEPPSRWQGPQWDDFVTAMSDPKTAKEVTIITARGHDPALFLEGLRSLQNKGFFRHLPELKNIFPVSNPKIGGAVATPAATKAKIVLALLDQLNARALSEGPTLRILNPNGDGEGQFHQWDYSDDDPKNILKVRDVLGPEFAKNRWPNVKITLTYTGVSGKLEPRTYVIKSDGKTRHASKEEVADFAKHLALVKCSEELQ